MNVILQSRFQKIARAMTRNWGVSVEPHATKCSTNGKDCIYYPANVDHLSEKTQNAVHGLLDHEVLHIIEEQKHKRDGLKTPMEYVRNYSHKKEKLAFNVFEDIRIEQQCEYDGMVENLDALGRVQNELFRKRAHSDFWKSIGCAVIDSAFERPTDWLPVEFRPYLDALKTEIIDCKSMVHASDSHELAVRMLHKVEETNEQLSKELHDKENQESVESSSACAGGRDGEGENGVADVCDRGGNDDRHNSFDNPSGDSTGEEAQEDQPGDAVNPESAPGAGRDKGDDSEGAPETQDGDSETESQGEETPSTSPSKEATSVGAEDETEGEGACPSGLSAQEIRDTIATTKRDASSVDVYTDIKQQIEYESSDAANHASIYIPNPNALAADTWIKPTVEGAREKGAYTTERNEVSAQIRGLKGKLLNMLRTRTDCVTTSGHKRGRLDKGKLARLVAGNGNVCKRIERGENIDTAVSMLFDMSGSMGCSTRKDHKARYAKLVAIAMSETLDSLQVPFETLGFSNTWFNKVKPMPGTHRTSVIEYTVFKEFSERFGKVKLRLNRIDGNGCNTDGEAVLAVAERLAKRPEKRKILVVASDGQPQSGDIDCYMLDAHLKHVISMVTNFGIEVIAFGIKSDAVKNYYNKTTGARAVVIRNLDTMAVDVYKVTKQAFLEEKV